MIDYVSSDNFFFWNWVETIDFLASKNNNYILPFKPILIDNFWTLERLWNCIRIDYYPWNFCAGSATFTHLFPHLLASSIAPPPSRRIHNCPLPTTHLDHFPYVYPHPHPYVFPLRNGRKFKGGGGLTQGWEKTGEESVNEER